MQGYPKTLNTKEDFMYVKEHFPKSAWQQDFQDLLDTRYEWYDVEVVESPESGITDDTHRVIPLEHEDSEGNKTTTYMQQEYRFNENCRMLRLGFTADELETALAE